MSDTVQKKIGNLTVTIERALCIGSRNCIKVEPELFELDSEGIAAFPENAGDLSKERVVEACDVCPVQALIVHDEAGGQVVP